MNNYYNKHNNTIKSTIESLLYNKYTYLAFNILFLVLAQITNDYPRVFFSTYFMVIFSYLFHKWSHKIPLFKKLHLVHHTKKINKYFISEVLECILNLLFIGGGILIPLNMYFNNKYSPFNNYAVLLYTLIYTFQHMIVYHYLPIPTHKTHHLFDKSCIGDTCEDKSNVFNYGPDAMDALFGTKKHLQEYEDMSPLIPFVILLIILLIFNYDNKYDVIKWLKGKI